MGTGICGILTHAKVLKSNLMKDQRTVLKQLRRLGEEGQRERDCNDEEMHAGDGHLWEPEG